MMVIDRIGHPPLTSGRQVGQASPFVGAGVVAEGVPERLAGRPFGRLDDDATQKVKRGRRTRRVPDRRARAVEPTRATSIPTRDGAC
jgi:hypothetical protein